MIRPVRRHFYLLSALPELKSFGIVPPVDGHELLALVVETGGPVEVVRTMLLRDDLLQREAVLAGEIMPEQADVAVLTLEQIKGEEPLPDFLTPGEEGDREAAGHPIAADRIWERYYRHVSYVAQVSGTPFLMAWAGFEVGLRNALAGARAEALGLEPGPYQVAPELGDPKDKFRDIVSGWIAAENPLEALEILDRARWHWTEEHEAWYSFSDDEVAAYTAKLMILHRFRRITGKGMESMI